ncbi:MAG: radical SAM protein, partial [Elusimicrobia bacterium]|nr:radical SAM protein [Elusimicrobiota bacterium]
MKTDGLAKQPDYVVPFKQTLAYFKEVLKGDPANLDRFPQLHKASGWNFNCDLHHYPYVHARPSMLSVGCKNNCFFCRTAEEFKGRVYYGDYAKILSNYENEQLHFMDEDFFTNPSMDGILKTLKGRRIIWLALTTYRNMAAALDKYGEDYLYECGMRTVELGLENVVLCRKVETHLPLKKIRIYYLNLTALPGETKETIQENARWMTPRSMP